MRGTFGRSRADKTQPGVVISTYEGALYPPRPYRYYVVQAQLPSVSPSRRSATPGASGAEAGALSPPLPQAAPALILPSVDSDTVCTPRPRAAHPPPSLRTFFPCFVQSASPAGVLGQPPPESDAPLQSLSEPLNVMHYPRLLPCWQNLRPSTAKDDGSASPPGADAVSADLARLAKLAGLPAELYSVFTTAHVEYPSRPPLFGQDDPSLAHSAAGAAATPAVFVVRKPERLRVCPVPRHAPPRPVRRGTKVTVVSAEGQQDLVAPWQRTSTSAVHAVMAHAGRKRGRDEIPLSELFNMAGEEEEDEAPRPRPKPTSTHALNDDEDAQADGDDDDADDISVGLGNADDDDLGGIDGSGGSGDDDGDYF